MITVKTMTIDDILDIPSEFLSTNRVAGSKILELDETVWRKRAIGYAAHDSVEVLGAYDDEKILGVVFVIWARAMPSYMVSNLRLFHNIPGFAIEKNGYAALLAEAIKRGEEKGRWEFYMRRNLDYGRWFNKKYIQKVYDHIPISRKYLRTIEEIILANQQSKWPSINILCNNEIVGEDTAIIKYFCPQESRKLDYLPESFLEEYKDTLRVLDTYNWWEYRQE